ncbi:MAG: hypothetical protein P8M72_07725 [Gammaproteobacteria bacterium]|nr:hypothetical protein [Gammaproteobacteria bacterium]
MQLNPPKFGSPMDAAQIISNLAPDIRIHTKMFPVYFSQPERYRTTAYRFIEVMLEVAERTEGSFELVEYKYSKRGQ